MSNETGSEPVPFAVIGAGWRTGFFARVARELPGRFRVAGVVARSPEKAARFGAEWGVPTFTSLDELLRAERPAFVIVSVSWDSQPEIITDCAGRGLPVLTETPPARDVPLLLSLCDLTRAGAKVQVAEQYARQPLHQALLSLTHGGKIGIPTQAQVSVAHGYHGVSLLRRYLGVRFEDATITATKFTTPLVASPGRDAPPTSERVVPSGQTIAHFKFDDGRFGVYDFTGDQYFSFVRGPRLLVRGERGEIVTEPGGDSALVRYLLAPSEAVSEPVRRVDTGHAGNLEGYHHRGYTCAGEWVYRNPFAPRAGGYVGGRLSDDEIAIATQLDGMARYAADTGPEVYPLAEAAQDRYLDLLIEEAARTGNPVRSSRQPWR